VGNQLARLHVIFYDTSLADTSTYLKVGVMQLVLAMLEADRGNDSLILDDPLSALLHWGHDPELRATARLLDGKRVTAVELQLSFLEAARACAAHGVFDGYVEDAGDILDLWEDTLLKLQERDFHALSARLDWVIKRAVIERAIAREPGMTWESPRAKFLDLMYSCISADEGLFWQLEQAGLVQRLVSDADVAKLASLPPEDTRAWTRATLLGIAGAEQVERIDWDTIAFRLQGVDGVQRKVLKLADPQAFTRASVLPLISEADSLAGLLDALGAVDVPSGNGAGGPWTTAGSRCG
jgi:proteasome accessory factor A